MRFMINEDFILKFIEKQAYDLRISNNARWIDQKCTPDVLSIVSDCILNYIELHDEFTLFNSKDIWLADYTKENVELIFSKPDTKQKKTANEYDKFFAQPLELLAYSNVLKKIKKGRYNYYQVNEEKILEYIALKEKNSVEFLYLYINEVLKQSDLIDDFTDFFNTQSKESYYKLKSKFVEFIIENTKINKSLEVRRIFTKIINPLAFKLKKKGTAKGRISKNIITYSNLMYNQENFRDINNEKPKNITRNEWASIHKKEVNVEYFKYQSIKSKRFIKKYNDTYRNGVSEVNDGDKELATQVHHIFPQNEYPEISMYYENLIALTPNQHFIKAHPENNTQIIDESYQEILLKSKAGIIEEDFNKNGDNSIYNFDQLISVLNVGFNNNYEIYDNDFVAVMEAINAYYR